jgi:hypothetical protein
VRFRHPASILLLLALAWPAHAGAENASASAHAQATPPSVLGDEPMAPGQFAWQPQLSPTGPVLVLVDLDAQQLFVYRNGLRIGRSSVSTGKPGFETPSGVFTILQKHREHYSNLYDNAPMPFMQRLTWSGVALHAGKVPGYPASHGCVRLPYAFSELLFGATSTGATVVIGHGGAPSLVAGNPLPAGASEQASEEAWSWHELVPGAGPLTFVLAAREQLVVALRNGVEIGRARIGVEPGAVVGTSVYMLLGGDAGIPSRIVPGRPALRWLALGGPGQADREVPLGAGIAERVVVPPGFALHAYDALAPGATVVVTDEALKFGGPGSELTILRGDEE